MKRMYPGARPGPLGEIGLWSGLLTLAGDASGGNGNMTLILPEFLRKLGFTVDWFTWNSNDGTPRSARLQIDPKISTNHVINYVVTTVTATGVGNSFSNGSDLPGPGPTVFSPTSGTTDPRLILTVVNPGAGVTLTLEALGRVYPHQFVQRQPQATIGPTLPVPV